jgi:hypothetical protein
VKSRIGKHHIKRKQGPLHETLAQVANQRNEKLFADGDTAVIDTPHVSRQV